MNKTSQELKDLERKGRTCKDCTYWPCSRNSGENPSILCSWFRDVRNEYEQESDRKIYRKF